LKPPSHIQDRLRRIGKLPSEKIRLADTALFLAKAIDRDKRVTPYMRHLKKLCFDVVSYIGPIQVSGNDNTGPALDLRAEALRQVLAKRFGYGLAPDSMGALEASNFMHAIDTRSGSDSALAILYIHVARSLGWPVCAINFPGRILVRLETAPDKFGERAIFDPNAGFKACAPQDLRQLLKETQGEQAELSPAHYDVLDNRALLLRLEGDIKSYLLEQDRFFDAADIIDITLMLAPLETDLWHEAGHLHARLDQVTEAIDALEALQRLNAGDEKQYRTSLLLQELRGRLQ
jgi:regulator of sirC expression with transglutaminase-like and TPR domain